jgi:hypothetical protein
VLMGQEHGKRKSKEIKCAIALALTA